MSHHNEVAVLNRKVRWNWPIFWLRVIKNSYSEGIIDWKVVILMVLNIIISVTFTIIVTLLLRDFVVHNLWYARLIILVVAYFNGLWIGTKSANSITGFSWKLVLISGALAAFWMGGVYGLVNTLLGIGIH